MFSKKEFILGAIVFFWGGMAVGYTMARAKFIELMSKAALDSAIKNQHKEEESE